MNRKSEHSAKQISVWGAPQKNSRLPIVLGASFVASVLVGGLFFRWQANENDNVNQTAAEIRELATQNTPVVKSRTFRTPPPVTRPEFPPEARPTADASSVLATTPSKSNSAVRRSVRELEELIAAGPEQYDNAVEKVVAYLANFEQSGLTSLPTGKVLTDPRALPVLQRVLERDDLSQADREIVIRCISWMNTPQSSKYLLSQVDSRASAHRIQSCLKGNEGEITAEFIEAVSRLAFAQPDATDPATRAQIQLAALEFLEREMPQGFNDQLKRALAAEQVPAVREKLSVLAMASNPPATGILIERVQIAEDEPPASDMGLRPGDVLLDINGQVPVSTSTPTDALLQTADETIISFMILREGKVFLGSASAEMVRSDFTFRMQGRYVEPAGGGDKWRELPVQPLMAASAAPANDKGTPDF